MFDAAMIGLGYWARRLISSVQGESDAIRFTRAMTRTPSKVADFAAEHGFPVDDDLSALLADPAIDGVVVSGPAGLHAEHALAAVNAGKHTLVIKPMALTRADAEALTEAAAAKGVLLAMGYDRCFMGATDALRDCVNGGELGKILHAEGNFCVGRYFGMKPGSWKSDQDQSPPGSLADHMLYTMIELMGPVAEVSVQGARHVIEADMDDTVSVTLKFASGAGGLLTAIGVTADLNRLHLFGTDGWAEIRGNSRFEFQPREGDAQVSEHTTQGALRRELETFAAAVQGNAAFPVTPDAAINGVAVLEAMSVSKKTGKPVVI